MFIFSKRKKRLEEMKNYSHMFQRRKKLEEEKKNVLEHYKVRKHWRNKYKLST
jgi:hypothetical protein